MDLVNIYKTCDRCHGTGLPMIGDTAVCSKCGGDKNIVSPEHIDVTDIMDKLNDILDKCNDIFEKVNE